MTDTSQKPRRVRLTRDERIRQILDVSTRLVSRHGFYGLSLPEVAKQVGITQAGLLHYVHTKEGLLQLIIEQGYDQRFDPEDFAATGDPAATHPDGMSFPAYCHYLVAHNAQDPQLIRLYMVLSAESVSPEHPAHAYFHDRPDRVWELYSRTRWRIPPQVGDWSNMRPLVEQTIAAMDGLQLRMFRSPAIDLPTAWRDFEQVLFPAPIWDDYR